MIDMIKIRPMKGIMNLTGTGNCMGVTEIGWKGIKFREELQTGKTGGGWMA
jgi:hypothetical protein